MIVDLPSFSSYFRPLSFPNLGLVRFPEVRLDPDQRAAVGIKSEKAHSIDILKRLAWDGYKRLRDAGRFGDIPEEKVIAQFRTEFETCKRTAVADYLLLVWDINQWADQQGIVRGYGRGSAGGSLIMYTIGVTRVNPLRHNLDFPRFISEARLKPVVRDGVTLVDGKAAPDVDCDYEFGRRGEVVQYVEQRYPGRVSKIGTRLEFTGKTALKEVCKVYLGLSDEEARAVSDLIEVKFGKVDSLAKVKDSQAVKDWIAKDPARHGEAYAIAAMFEGLTVAHGQHPSGVFVGYEPLDGNMPLELSKTGEPVTSYDMETVAGLGTKVDLLGLRTLDLVARTARHVGINAQTIDVEDSCIYEYLKIHCTYLGLFQISDGLTKEAARRIGPRNVDELAVVLAISRPGAMVSIPKFERYVKTGEIESVHPALDAALKSTGGALVMQEQITQVCRDVCGLSGVDADQVRYAIGKKKREEMEKWESTVREGGRRNGIPDSVIDLFWATCSASADYLFNASHALLYAYLTAATTYLKAKYPLPFYLTMLQLSREEPNPTEVMNQVIAEARDSGFQILPPDLLKSEADFTIEPGSNAIRFGLQSIKGVSETTMAKLASFKRQFANRFEVFEAARSAKVPINTLVSLIYSGCLDTGGAARSYYALNAQLYNLLTDREKPLVHRLAQEYQDDLIALLKDLPNRKDEKGKPLIRDTRLATLRRDYAPYWQMYQQNSQNEELCCYLMERELLGFSYTSSLFTVYAKRVVGLTPLKAVLKSVAKVGETEARPKFEPVKVVAFVGETKKCVSKKDGTPYLKLGLYDDEAQCRAMVFGERYAACQNHNGRAPEEGDVVVATGGLSKDGTLFFVDSLTIQPNPVSLKKGVVPEATA